MSMEFIPQRIPGLIEIKPKILTDQRGRFVKTLHAELYAKAGICNEFAEECWNSADSPWPNPNSIVFERDELFESLKELNGPFVNRAGPGP